MALLVWQPKFLSQTLVPASHSFFLLDLGSEDLTTMVLWMVVLALKPNQLEMLASETLESS